MNVRRTTSRDPAFRALIVRLDRELRGIYGDTEDDTYATHNLVDTETAVVATIAAPRQGRAVTIDGTVVGCGCFKAFDAETIELKRFFVDPQHRGAGVGRAMIAALEAWAKEIGYRAAVLETGVEQARAIALYEGTGYTRTANYGPYVGLPLSICMRKAL